MKYSWEPVMNLGEIKFRNQGLKGWEPGRKNVSNMGEIKMGT